LDNRRLRAALDAGLERVPFTVHEPGERLLDWPHEWDPDRIARNALGVDIREVNGRLVVGGDEGVVRYAKGTLPETYGEIALFRAADQRSLLPGRLWGAEEPPVTLRKPPTIDLHPVVPAEVREGLAAEVARAESPAERALTDLQAVGRVVGQELHLDKPLDLRGVDDRIKTLDSLVRKYHDEGRAFGQSVADFLGEVNDLTRFSMELPDGARYRPALEAALAELDRRGYHVVETAGKVGVKNFWEAGNRYLGLNVTVRSPHDGRLMEIQFPTDLSWRANKLSHGFYGVFREPRELTVRVVHAALNILSVNKRLGLTEEMPSGLSERWPPVDTSFGRWVAKRPDVWAEYHAWLAENGRTFGDIMREFGLTE